MTNCDYPIATYRVQMTGEFGFASAGGIAPYLHDLGVSHLYCSPYLQATPGSTHGYDVTDPTRVNEELGGPEAHANMCDALSAAGLRQMLDIVPNHLCTHPDNRAWMDVLRLGESSQFAGFFDIDWQFPRPTAREKVMLCVLGMPYGQALANGEIKVRRNGGSYEVGYFDNVFPLAPDSLRVILRWASIEANDEVLAFLGDALGMMGSSDMSSATLYRNNRVIMDLLEHHLSHNPASAKSIDTRLEALSNDERAMDELLELQHYRLAYWRLAASEINYRRFFAINTLAGVRIENSEVFHYVHDTVLDWVSKGMIDALRVDHIDGLVDPFDYLRKLRSAVGEKAWVLVEKILMPEERLSTTWPVEGTTGYDFLNVVNGLFVDSQARDNFTDFYIEFTGCDKPWPEVLRLNKHMVLREEFGAETTRLVNLAVSVAGNHLKYRDLSRDAISRVLIEVIACFGVYRIYARPAFRQISTSDIERVDAALALAREKGDRPDDAVIEFLRDLLTMNIQGDLETQFILRFGQLTGPATAKGMEDTSYYCYYRLASLNEVGGDPATFGSDADDFHNWCLYMRQTWPATMLATSTHDTKRGEDARVRISMLSERPDEWFNAVRRWSQRNKTHRTDDMPSRNDEYMIYQTLIGAWPIDTDRMKQYVIKACREAKRHTSWNEPDEQYEKAVVNFACGIIEDADFMKDLLAFLEPMILPARVSSLAQTLLKCTACGVPDIYQGSELWNLSLVDPDNRRQVDYDHRRRLLDSLPKLTPRETLDMMDEGLPKMIVIKKALELRKRLPQAFDARGEYLPIKAQGTKARHVVAFSRGGLVVAVAPRLVFSLGDWANTTVTLPDGEWKNVFTEQTHRDVTPLGEMLQEFPVALLSQEE